MTIEDDLKRRNIQHWKDFDPGNPEPVLMRYIADLLPEELKYMQDQGRLFDKKCDLLVLLVGHSLEPLLQSICNFKPSKILLIVNKKYGLRFSGFDQAERIKRLAKKLVETGLLKDEISFERDAVVQADSVVVFQTLQKRLRDQINVIVDITGAKKNMSAGAFLFAAYANIPIAYVDSNDTAFDENMHKPYGYDSTIRILETPYQTFGLRDWERIQNSYEQYNFRQARLILMGDQTVKEPGILEVIQTYLQEAVKPAQLLAKVLKCYEQWDAGNYYSAKKLADEIAGFSVDFRPPEAVVKLGFKFPQNLPVTKSKLQPPDYFYDLDSECFRVYVFDELARVQRQIKYYQDYRSAFLGAASLNEILMLARLALLIRDPGRTNTFIQTWRDGITPKASSVFGIMAMKQDRDIDRLASEIAIDKNEIPAMRWHEQVFTHKPPEWNVDGKAEWEAFLNTRNQLAHKFLTPPCSWAEEALTFVSANVKDLWPDATPVYAERLPWRELCERIGLDKYLTFNLIQ